jgi:MOSC domain-containing protein
MWFRRAATSLKMRSCSHVLTGCATKQRQYCEPYLEKGYKSMAGTVAAVSLSPAHTFSKPSQERIRLLAGLGVEGDAHLGETVKHRSRVKRDPSQPNLRQVHLIHAELHDELRAAGFDVSAGQMGENVTTRGVDLLGLPTGTRLRLGDTAVIEITGLRNPCYQLDDFQQGLMAATLDRDEHGALVRKAGVMAIVLTGGEVRPGDPITLELPPEPHQPLEPV